MRSNFNSSKLVRLLSDWQLADADLSGPDFAERLSLWLSAFDAMKLHAAHQVAKTIADQIPDLSQSNNRTSGEDALHRVKAMLVKAATETRLPPVEEAGLDKQGRPIDVGPDTAAAAAAVDYAPYRQSYLNQQHQMDMRVKALRAHVRDIASQVSPQMKQLATLDAVMGDMLAEREHKLLATLPSLLKKRFEHLRHMHQQRLAVTQQPDDPALWRQPHGWLNRFDSELREVLSAELSLRLEPVLGLIAALNSAGSVLVTAKAATP